MMASTVKNGIDRLRNGNQRRLHEPRVYRLITLSSQVGKRGELLQAIFDGDLPHGFPTPDSFSEQNTYSIPIFMTMPSIY